MRELGPAVRRLREAAPPPGPVGGRRAPGLRREELAELAGVSADYLRRLEQGRRHPSPGVLDAVARALRLGRADYERLCALAGYAPAAGRVPREAGPAAVRLLERAGTPAFLCDAAWNVVAVNSAWIALQCGPPTEDPRDWNVAWRAFGAGLGGIDRTPDSAAGFRAMLAARLHAAALRHPGDEPLAALVDDLRRTSGAFDAAWRTPRAVTAYENRAVFRHPGVGPVTLDGALLTVPGDDLAAVFLTAAPGSADAARLGEVVAAATGPAVVRVGQVGPG